MRLAGAEYEVDLGMVRQALDRWRLSAQASPATVQSLAEHSDLSRCTVWRFLSGRPVGLMAAKRIIATLGLDVQEVLRPVRRPPASSIAAILASVRAVVGAHEGAAESLQRLRDLDSRLDELATILRRWDSPQSEQEADG